MEAKEFKELFGSIAKSRGFNFQFGAWFKESQECILLLELQKSNFGNFYYLNIKGYILDILGRKYCISKELKKDLGNFMRRPPGEYHNFFDLDVAMEDDNRKQGIVSLFDDFLIPFSNKALFRKGVHELANNEIIILPPALKKDLDRLINAIS